LRLSAPRAAAASVFEHPLGVSTLSDLGSSLAGGFSERNTEVVDDREGGSPLEILQKRPTEILTLTAPARCASTNRHTMTFRLVVATVRVVRATTCAKREFNFDDSQVLAKEQEEALLFRDMQADLVDQLIRRLAAANP